MYLCQCGLHKLPQQLPSYVFVNNLAYKVYLNESVRHLIAITI